MTDRPKSIWKPSPNFTPKDPGRAISCVVIHATATEDKESPLNWLCDPKSQVSAHYLIDRLGAIYHLVHEQNIAWHAGQSSFHGINGVNDFSVGIELVNDNKDQNYPAEQLQACSNLVADICREYKISEFSVVGHADIAPGRKTDPYKFPWFEFREILANKIKEIK